ncbi:MAG TPA: hypothetical protein VGB55_13895 [Tepidisphaeraceae bacterium]|jgi:hypothetical protein
MTFRLFQPRQWACLTLLAVAGCNVLGAAIYKIGGEPDVPAEHTLEQRPTLVLVENFVNPDLAANDAEFLARKVYTGLQAQNAAPLVPYEKLLELRSSRGRTFSKMTTKQIGEAVGAEQVLYISLEGGGVTSMGGGSVLQGNASAMVKVIDVKSGNSLWPIELSDGRAISFETDPTHGTDRYRPDEVRTALYSGLATNIVRLFHKWKPGDSSEVESLKE